MQSCNQPLVGTRGRDSGASAPGTPGTTAVLRVATLLVVVLAATGPAAAHAGHEAGTPSTPLEPPDDDGWPPLAVGAGVLGLLVAAGWLGRASGILTRRQAGALFAGSLVVVLCVLFLVAG